MLVAAAVILQPGKVEAHAMPDVPPPSLRFYKPSRTMFWPKNSDEPIRPTLDIETYEVLRHRVVGLSVMVAYWPESWQDEWAIEELLKWEGREDEIRRDQYYADSTVDANQQARENERRAIESQSVRRPPRPVVLVVRESVPESRVDPRADIPRWTESDGYLRLERGASGGHVADLQGKDAE